jgi:hypothetical protein
MEREIIFSDPKKSFSWKSEFIIKKFLLLMQILLEKKRMNSGNSFIDSLLEMIIEKRIFSFVIRL